MKVDFEVCIPLKGRNEIQKYSVKTTEKISPDKRSNLFHQDQGNTFLSCTKFILLNPWKDEEKQVEDSVWPGTHLRTM